MQVENKQKKGVLRYLWYFILIANFVAILLLFCSVLAWKVSPETTTVFAYLGMAFPFILVANITFLIFWIICFRWKFAIISFIPLLICISPILTYFPIHFKTKEIPEDCIKLLSYNVKAFDWKGETTADNSNIIKFIRESEADIVCIQEFMAADLNQKRNIEAIKKALKEYPYYSVTDLWPKMKNYTYGLACFSKYPITETTKIPYESEVNGSVLYKIDLKGKPLYIINNHLESNRLTSDDKKIYQDLIKDTNRKTIDDAMHNIKDKLGTAFQTRAPQAEMVYEWAEKLSLDNRLIVCGDFNDTPISYTYHTIKGDLTDSFATTGFGPGITYHENHFLFRIDFIMHTENIKSYNTSIGNNKDSDHYPIWTHLQIE